MRVLPAALIVAALTIPVARVWALPSSPAERVRALIERAGAFGGISMPQFGSFPARLPAASEAPASAVPAGLWDRLSAPDAATSSALVRRIPGLDAAVVRTMSPEAAEEVFAVVAARGLTPLDFFTDPAFRGREVYYIPPALLASTFARYDIQALTAVSGRDTDGNPFRMQGLVLGGGRVEALYDRDRITFEHPDFDNGLYTLEARVSQGILGPGDMSVSGITAHVAFFKARIQRITKISPTEARVQTSKGTRNKPVAPIRRRAAGAL